MILKFRGFIEVEDIDDSEYSPLIEAKNLLEDIEAFVNGNFPVLDFELEEPEYTYD